MLRDLSIPALIHAIEANNEAFYAQFASLPHAEFHQSAELTWFATGSPIALFNGVTRTHISAPEVDAQIDAQIAVFRQRNVPFLWQLGPSTQPEGLGEHLEAHGLIHLDDGTGMAADLWALRGEIVAPPALRIVPVTTTKLLHQWVTVFVGRDAEGVQPCVDVYAGLGFDHQAPLQHFLGVLDGEPVATSSYFVAEGVVSVQHVATLVEARRQGIGGAMTLAALRAARDQGHRTAVLISSSMAVDVYRRLGFKEYCAFDLYAWPGEPVEGTSFD